MILRHLRPALSRVLSCVLACVVAAPAVARDDLPAPIAQALAMGEARREPDQRWAFTCRLTLFERNDGVVEVNAETVVARFDPRRPEDEEWRLVSPASEDALTEGQSKIWSSIPDQCRSIDNVRTAEEEQPRSGCRRRPVVRGPRRVGRMASRPAAPPEARYEPPHVAPSTAAPGTPESRAENGEEIERIVVVASCGERQEPPTDWDTVRGIIGDDVALLSENAAQKLYGFNIKIPDAAVQNVLFKPLLRHFHGEAAVTAERPRLTSLRIYATPFRVPGLARANELDIMVHFGEVEPGGPIAPVRFEQSGAGSALRHRGESRATMVFSDFERVEVAG